MTVLAKVARGSDDDIETIDAGFDSDFSILEMASYVGKDFSFQLMNRSEVHFRNGLSAVTYTEVADSFAVPS